MEMIIYSDSITVIDLIAELLAEPIRRRRSIEKKHILQV